MEPTATRSQQLRHFDNSALVDKLILVMMTLGDDLFDSTAPTRRWSSGVPNATNKL